MNHPFIDGNKRIGLRAADVFLMLNYFEIWGPADDLISITIRMTTGEVTREDLTKIVSTLMRPYP